MKKITLTHLSLCKVARAEREETPWSTFCYHPIQKILLK